MLWQLRMNNNENINYLDTYYKYTATKQTITDNGFFFWLNNQTQHKITTQLTATNNTTKKKLNVTYSTHGSEQYSSNLKIYFSFTGM